VYIYICILVPLRTTLIIPYIFYFVFFIIQFEIVKFFSCHLFFDVLFSSVLFNPQIVGTFSATLLLISSLKLLLKRTYSITRQLRKLIYKENRFIFAHSFGSSRPWLSGSIAFRPLVEVSDSNGGETLAEQVFTSWLESKRERERGWAPIASFGDSPPMT
jgi:hypothetical protein